MTLELQRQAPKDSENPFYIDEIIRGRRAKRGFTDKPVPIEVVKDILSIARFTPSSSNTQPWKCYVLTGKARERLVEAAVKNFNDNHDKLVPEYPFFPDPIPEPHASWFTKFRGQLGDAQGVERSDKEGRRRDVARQFKFFGAPVGLIFTMDRRLVPASFICYGGFLQTVMLAAKGRGLDTLAQQIWSLQYPLLRKELGIPESDMVVCGMCIGYADNGLPENDMALDKFGPEKFATFLDA
ncbi:nitroreductase [Bradyrhizobium sp. CER78]|uniref:nitroreductase n=1 Tax=Bradyrhizobium sp. CER78 TaxID=3039162 RepID=UPI00244AA7AC|nr:nitroreductase [Bradyrhizobium sp. CER78]MDH2384486.1 nitroreductase [Bradyrhizobium sp. CER78]